MQKALLFSICMAVGVLSFAQPGNDLCGDAEPVSSAQLDDGNGNCTPISGTTTDATEWLVDVMPDLYFVGGCWSAEIVPVVFYSFIAEGVSGSVEVTGGPVGETPLVSVIEFNSGACDGTDVTEYGCSSDGTPIEFDNDLVIGNEYFVVVGFTNSGMGDFDICVFNPEPAPNDLCSDAFEVTNLDGTPCVTNQTNYYPSSENVVPVCFGANTYSVWYWFTAQGVSIADLHIEGNLEDANIAIWDFSNGGSCADLGAGTIIECQTDVDAVNPIIIDNQLEIGNDYWIEVSFNNNSTNENFSLCLDNPVPVFNDDCIDAIEFPDFELSDEFNCVSNIGGQALTNDYPSTDLGVPSCWDPSFTYNVWFSFVAQGPDADITVDMPGQVEQIALLRFADANYCDVASAGELECAVDEVLEVDDQLIVGDTYYVLVGFENNAVGDYCINIFNPQPPSNDTVCGAIPLPTDGSCNAGPPCQNNCYTTEYANPEFATNQVPPACAGIIENTVWFTVELDDPENVGFEITVNPVTGQNFGVAIMTWDDCNGFFDPLAFYCTLDAEPIEFGPVEDDQEYYIMVGTPNVDEGEFQICVNEIPPCFDNNFCEDPLGLSSANDIGEITTTASDGTGNCAGAGDPFTCVMGCNFLADEVDIPTNCMGANDPVVWFQFSTDANAALANIFVTSQEFEAPAFQLFQSLDGTCGDVIPIGECSVGSAGEASLTDEEISAVTTYFLAVGGINTVGGDFEVCISILENLSACVLDADVEVTARSLGDDLEGPFFPGEVVSVCLNVNTYTSSGNNCQWIQGIIPTFGNGWDPSSFDGNGMPVDATLNGSGFPAPSPIGAAGAIWEWFPDGAVYYHHDNCFYNVGDFDGNGTLDICSALYDVDCDGPGLTGGQTGPCWDINPGNPLPGGWFSYGINGLCPTPGSPSVDYGDGTCCSCNMGPWNVCFDLMVREYPDCDQDPTTQDLSIGFITTADGETGSWNGGPSVCANDIPTAESLPICCNELVNLNDEHDPLCSDGLFSWIADYPEIDFWEWSADAGSVIGTSEGSGPNGTSILDNLSNPGASSEIVTYSILGFDGGDCPAVIWEVMVEVFPDIMIEIEPFVACATPTDPYEIVPIVTGGDASSYEFLWFDGSTDPTLTVANPSGQINYSVTVTDANGCESENFVKLTVYETFPVDIDAPVTEQCLVDGEIDLSANAEDGIPGYTFEWTSPTGGNSSGPNVSTNESGQWNVLVTDSEGCIGEDSVTLDFHESPTVEVFPENVAVCLGSPTPTQIQALVQQGESPYDYEWTTPTNTYLTSFIIADEIGQYNLLVTDNNGCTAQVFFEVDEAPAPEIILDSPIMLCEEELLSYGYEIEVPDDPSYLFFEWSTGQDNMTSIEVFTPGMYEVTVTNEYGCEGVGMVEVDVFPEIDPNLPDSVEFCAGGFALIEADPDFGYDWSTGSSSSDIFIFNEQTLLVTVTDENGCTIEDQIEVVELDFLQPDIIGDSVICNGVPVDIVANTGFDIYEWSTGEEDVSTITVTSGGWYYVSVSDGAGCWGEDSVLVVESAPDPAVVGDPAICAGQTASLDVGAWSDIEWSTGENTSVIMTDTAGLFTVTVTDAFGCQNTTSYQVVESTTPEPDIVGATSFCTGSSTMLDAGPGFASYQWSTTENTQAITVNTGGTYYLTVTNNEGCEGFDTVVVVEDSALQPTITGDDVVCSSVPVQLDAGSGYTAYEWSTTENTQTITVGSGNTYVVTVTDANGCTGTDEFVVNEGDPMPTINGVASVCEGGMETIGVVEVFNSYEWSTTENTQTIDVKCLRYCTRLL